MTSENFYYILPELALSISLDKDNDALMIIKEYCDKKDYIRVELTETEQLNFSTDELATGIYCGLDPIAIITCVGLITIGRCWKIYLIGLLIYGVKDQIRSQKEKEN